MTSLDDLMEDPEEDFASFVVEELEGARAQICEEYARLYGVLKAHTDQLPIEDRDRRCLDPDFNGFEQGMDKICDVIDNAINTAFKSEQGAGL